MLLPESVPDNTYLSNKDLPIELPSPVLLPSSDRTDAGNDLLAQADFGSKLTLFNLLRDGVVTTKTVQEILPLGPIEKADAIGRININDVSTKTSLMSPEGALELWFKVQEAGLISPDNAALLLDGEPDYDLSKLAEYFSLPVLLYYLFRQDVISSSHMEAIMAMPANQAISTYREIAPYGRTIQYGRFVGMTEDADAVIASKTVEDYLAHASQLRINLIRRDIAFAETLGVLSAQEAQEFNSTLETADIVAYNVDRLLDRRYAWCDDIIKAKVMLNQNPYLRSFPFKKFIPDQMPQTPDEWRDFGDQSYRIWLIARDLLELTDAGLSHTVATINLFADKDDDTSLQHVGSLIHKIVTDNTYATEVFNQIRPYLTDLEKQSFIASTEISDRIRLADQWRQRFPEFFQPQTIDPHKIVS